MRLTVEARYGLGWEREWVRVRGRGLASVKSPSIAARGTRPKKLRKKVGPAPQPKRWESSPRGRKRRRMCSTREVMMLVMSRASLRAKVQEREREREEACESPVPSMLRAP